MLGGTVVSTTEGGVVGGTDESGGGTLLSGGGTDESGGGTLSEGGGVDEGGVLSGTLLSTVLDGGVLSGVDDGGVLSSVVQCGLLTPSCPLPSVQCSTLPVAPAVPMNAAPPTRPKPATNMIAPTVVRRLMQSPFLGFSHEGTTPPPGVT
jgi:hypothetical protein